MSSSFRKDMEKLPHFTFIGKVEEKYKKQREEEVINLLSQDVRLSLSPEEMKEVEENEVVKTPEQEALFVSVDRYLNELMQSLGVESFQYPVHNVFLVKRDKYSRISDSGTALVDIGAQRIFLKEKEHNYQLVSALFHEMMHLKGKVVVQLLQNPENQEAVDAHIIRAGLGVMSPYKKIESGIERKDMLVGIEEAVVARQQALFNQVARNWSEFSYVKAKFQSDEGKQELEKIEQATGVSDESVIWFDNEKKVFDRLGYIPQREVLDYVCQEVSSELLVSFKDVHEEFLKSHFTGHLIKLAKMIEQAFGKGSFRVLAAMPAQGDEKVREVFEKLKHMRALVRST